MLAENWAKNLTRGREDSWANEIRLAKNLGHKYKLSILYKIQFLVKHWYI